MSGMVGSEYVSEYVKALNEVAQAVGVLRVVDTFYNVLWDRVRIPIQLQDIALNALNVLKKREQQIKEAFASTAKELGFREVIVPKIVDANIVFENVSVDSIDIKVAALEAKDSSNVVVVMLKNNKKTVGEFPIAWMGANNDGSEFRTTVEVVMLTALLVNRNPWLPQALKKAIEAAVGDYVKMQDEVLNFYNALKLLIAEGAK